MHYCAVQGPGRQILARKCVPPAYKDHMRRRYTGRMVLREIARLQNSVELAIPKAAFERLVRETMQNQRADSCITKDAIEALQEAAEKYLTDLFDAAGKVAKKGKRKTIFPEDLQFVRELRGEVKEKN